MSQHTFRFPLAIFKKQLKLFCVAFFLFHLALSVDGQVDILRKYIDTVSNGSVENWKKVKSVKIVKIGSYGYESYQFGKPVINDPLVYHVLYKIWPDKQKDETFRDSSYSVIQDQFFLQGNSQTVFMGNVPPVRQQVDEWSTWHFEFTPVKINKYIKESTAIRNLGKVMLPGKQIECFDIEIETRKGNRRFLINTKTFLLEAEYSPKDNVYWCDAEYKVFDGFLIPTYMTGVRNGVIFQWVQFKSVEFNVEIDAAKFKVP